MLSEARPRKGDHRERPLPLLFTRMRCALLKNICSALICTVGRALLKKYLQRTLLQAVGCALRIKYLSTLVCAVQEKYLQLISAACILQSLQGEQALMLRVGRDIILLQTWLYINNKLIMTEVMGHGIV